MSLTPTQKKNVRAAITTYCAQAVANEPRIHYSQQRPFPYINDIGHGFHTLDCSGFVGNVFWNAMHDTRIYLHDVCDYRYTGIGNTSSIESFLREDGNRVTDQMGYLVGDVARWGVGLHAHTAVCSKRGNAKTAVFTSHGREGGPNTVSLYYRTDLVGVWRHPALL